jgi:hypothetical protein
VTLGFFDDVFIPATAMPHPSRFDEKEQRWVWEVEAEEGKNELAMDVDDDIRFRVVSETFTDTSPTGPVGTAGGQAAEGDVEDGGKRCPYLLMVRFCFVLSYLVYLLLVLSKYKSIVGACKEKEEKYCLFNILSKLSTIDILIFSFSLIMPSSSIKT